MTEHARQLARFLSGQRWFGGKGRAIASVETVDHASLDEASDTRLAIVGVAYADGDREAYFLPLAAAGGADVYDALDGPDPDFCRPLLAAIRGGAHLSTARGGQLRFAPGVPRFGGRAPEPLPGTFDATRVRRIGAEQSNTSIVYNDALILKMFRRLQIGVNPEVEMLRFLAEHGNFDRIPTLEGWIEYRAPDGAQTSLGVLQRFVPNHGDGWTWMLRELDLLPGRGEGYSEGGDIDAHMGAVTELGRVTAGLHLALASSDGPDFAPEPITSADVQAWHLGITVRLDRVLRRLNHDPHARAKPVQELTSNVLAEKPRPREMVAGLDALADGGTVKTRIHGDYHLGQVLKTADGFVVIDFEGEPLRPLAERRARHTPLKDAAAMLRSFSYARHAAMRVASASAELTTRDSPLATWERQARRAFLDAYVGTCRQGGAHFLPQSEDALRRVLVALELEKSLYELEYELDNRPDWLAIPLAALAEAGL
ncbi:MAG: hypothetical protein H0V51_05045 [Chloroflexi bacterium]|nr:hypothetical protein [Chloroflexota bacterium]